MSAPSPRRGPPDEVTGLDKGVPGHVTTLMAAEVAATGWNVLREDLPFPVCVLRTGPLDRNIARLQRFADDHGVSLSPHGKTTMSPTLFDRQLAAGCWALTVATGQQLQVARRHGIGRILYANQLVGAAEVAFVAAELRRDPDLELWCLVDSVAGVRLLAERVATQAPGRPLRVLLEVGFAGGRGGVRDLATAVAVADEVRAHAPHLVLAGVEGFEGLHQYRAAAEREPQVRAFLRFLVEVAGALDARRSFGTTEVLLSAGGSAFYDLVVEELSGVRVSGSTRVVLRSGCYLVHDHGLYDRLLGDLQRRRPSPDLAFEPALEVWAQVLSVPEPGLVILSAGRRDYGQDAGDPRPVRHAHRGTATAQRVSDARWQVAGVSDHHTHLLIPPGHRVEVGDLVALGPSHPCTTLDKWRTIHLVDDHYGVVGAVRTWF